MSRNRKRPGADYMSTSQLTRRARESRGPSSCLVFFRWIFRTSRSPHFFPHCVGANPSRRNLHSHAFTVRGCDYLPRSGARSCDVVSPLRSTRVPCSKPFAAAAPLAQNTREHSSSDALVRSAKRSMHLHAQMPRANDACGSRDFVLDIATSLPPVARWCFHGRQRGRTPSK